MMREIVDLLKYCFKTRRAWWFTAVSKTKARYARTILGSLWLGISTLFTILCLGFIYGNVFKVENLQVHGGSTRYFIKRKGAKFKVEGSVKIQKRKEINFGLSNIKAYKLFAKRVLKNKKKLVEISFNIS